jgi:hypothetical protein
MLRIAGEADQGVTLQALEGARHARTREIASMCVEAQRDVADVLSHEGLVCGLHHAYGNVSLASQQVVDGI